MLRTIERITLSAFSAPPPQLKEDYMDRNIRHTIFSIVAFLAILQAGCFQAEKTNLDGSKPSGILLLTLFQPGTGTTTNANQFVAVGANCAVWTSLDGITWTGKESTASPLSGCSGGAIRGVAYGNGTWVAVGELTSGAGCGIWTSTDAVTWAQGTCPGGITNPLHSVAYGGGQWVAGAYDATNVRIIYSTNGAASWSTLTLLLGNPSTVDSIVYRSSASEFIMRSDRTGGTIATQFVPSNFASIAARATAPLNGNLRYQFGPADGNYLVAYGADNTPSSMLTYTTDGGATWIRRTTGAPGTDSAVHGVSLVSAFVHANGRYVIAHQSSPLNATCYLQSITSATTYTFTGPSGTQTGCTAHLTALAYHSTLGKFVAGGNGGQFGYSSTGVEASWTYSASGVSRVVNQIAVKQ